MEWYYFLVLFLGCAVIYNQCFKLGLKKSMNLASYMALVSILSGIFALLFIPIFEFKLQLDITKIFLLLIVCIIYAIVDRINVYVRKNMEVSIFSILKQISNVFMIVVGFIFYKEEFLFNRFIGIILILFGNGLALYSKGMIKLDKVLLMALLANLLFTITLFINVNLSDYFSLPLYVFIILFLPGIFICVFEKIGVKKIYNEFKCIDKRYLFMTAFYGSLMLISQLMAYNLGNITFVAPLCTLTIFLNIVFGYFILKERNNIVRKLVSSVIIIIAIFLIK